MLRVKVDPTTQLLTLRRAQGQSTGDHLYPGGVHGRAPPVPSCPTVGHAGCTCLYTTAHLLQKLQPLEFLSQKVTFWREHRPAPRSCTERRPGPPPPALDGPDQWLSSGTGLVQIFHLQQKLQPLKFLSRKVTFVGE